MSKEQTAPGELERVRAFVNTADLEAGADALADPDALAGWLVEAGLASAPPSTSRSDLTRALALREALRALLLTHNDGAGEPVEALAVLDDVACRARIRLRFDSSCEPLEVEAEGVAGALGRLLVIVHRAIADGSWTRLKACRDHECEWAFFDHTRNRSGAWCNMGVCGNRAKARAFRERRSGAAARLRDP